MARSARLLRRKFGSRHGQAAIEMAMTLPVVVAIIMLVIELGFAFNAYTTVVTAARHGARAGAVYLFNPNLDVATNTTNRERGTSGYQDNVTDTIKTSMGTLRSGLTYDVGIDYTRADPPLDTGTGDLINVLVTLHYRPVTGFFGNMTIDMKGQSSERLE